MKMATNRPSWMTIALVKKVATSNSPGPTKSGSSSADSPSSPKRARLSWMEDASYEPGVDSQGPKVSVLDELCAGSPLYAALGKATPLTPESSLPKPSESSDYMDGPERPSESLSNKTPMASALPQHSSNQSTAAATAATEAGMPKPSVPPQLKAEAEAEAEAAAGMPNSSVPLQPDPASAQAKMAAAMPKPSVPASAAAKTAAGMPKSSAPASSGSTGSSTLDCCDFGQLRALGYTHVSIAGIMYEWCPFSGTYLEAAPGTYEAACAEAETAAGMPNSSVPPQPISAIEDWNHVPLCHLSLMGTTTLSPLCHLSLMQTTALHPQKQRQQHP